MNSKSYYIASLLFCLLMSAYASKVFAEIIYVDHTATGLNDGSSWQNAFTDLNHALQSSLPGDEIWVSIGTYYPTNTNDRDITFDLKDQVDLLGGFTGNESRPALRDPENRTVLSGNIGNPDYYSDNSKHISWVSSTDVEMTLDGFVIEDGYAEDSSGGAVYTHLGLITFYNCIFRNNYSLYGGAICSTNSSNTFLNCRFENNSGVWGGAYQCWGGTNDRFYNCDFINNTSNYLGGAITAQLGTDITIDNSRFYGNQAQQGGAIMIEQSGRVSCMNNIFNGNSADLGAGICLADSSKFECFNSIIAQNVAASEGGGIYIEGGKIQVRNSVIHNNLVAGAANNVFGDEADIDIAYCLLEEWITGPGNLVANPLFLDPDGADNIIGNADDNFYTTMISPLMDAGTAEGIPVDVSDWDHNGNHSETYPFDLDWNPRISGSTIDIGPFEWQQLTSITEVSENYLKVSNPYPNPSYVCSIEIEAEKAQWVKIRLFDSNGTQGEPLFNGILEKGKNLIELESQSFSSGLCFIELKTQAQLIYRKWLIGF